MNDLQMIIQVQPKDAQSLSEYREALESWAKNTGVVKSFKIETSMDKEYFWNLRLITDDIESVWNSLEPIIMKFESQYDRSNNLDYPATIVVAEGSDSWKNYKNLYNNIPKAEKANKAKMH